jgi:preprotein translocase subunit SecG
MIFNIFTIFFLINSLLLIGLILNQNESTKDVTSNSSTNEMSNPLQNLTWFCVILEFLFFLIKSKMNDF